MIASGCINLQSVSFLGSHNLTDDSFKKLSLNKSLQQIKIDSKFDLVNFTHRFIIRFIHFVVIVIHNVFGRMINLVSTVVVVVLLGTLKMSSSAVRLSKLVVFSLIEGLLSYVMQSESSSEVQLLTCCNELSE